MSGQSDGVKSLKDLITTAAVSAMHAARSFIAVVSAAPNRPLDSNGPIAHDDNVSPHRNTTKTAEEMSNEEETERRSTVSSPYNWWRVEEAGIAQLTTTTTSTSNTSTSTSTTTAADIGFMMGATYIVVDTTLEGTFPKVFAASNARIPAFLANLAQGRKKKEYRHWKTKPPVEAFFVGIDHHGTISDDGIRLLHKVKRFAKLTKSYNGINTFWEHLSVGLVRGIAYGVDIMTHGEPPLGNEFALSAVV